MSGVRDPGFWKRFSMAVHLDEEKAAALSSISDKGSTSTISTKPQLKHTDTWLERTRQKQRRTKLCGWFIAFSFSIIIIGVVMVLLWYWKIGPFKQLRHTKHSSHSSTSTSTTSSTS